MVSRWVAAFGLVLSLCAPPAGAQQAPSLTVTVVDPTGAVIVGAQVQATPEGSVGVDAVTSDRGVARIDLAQPGRLELRVEAAGFEAATLTLTVGRATRRTVKLDLARVLESIDVGRDRRERASDPRSDIFTTVLGELQIRELPDDPDDMERMLREMAGPGAVMRVNGFRGGRLPPKDQIAQIRFRRNMFAADTHERGFIMVDVITKPGLENWRGSGNVGFRDASMNARNALAPARGAERHGRLALSVNGPLWRGHTSAALALDGLDAYDAQTIVAALPSGPWSGNVRRPTDAVNVSARLEHAVSPSLQLRGEVQRNGTTADNLGVGGFDLEERAYLEHRGEEVARGSLTGSFGRTMYNELRLSWWHTGITSASRVQAPTVSVLNAFTSGGAQVDGTSDATEWVASDDLDISHGPHALRTGFLIEAGRYQTNVLRNGVGTFTFSDLETYAAGTPLTFTRTAGRPDASAAQTRVGMYVQDDFRVSRSLMVSSGLRAERQSAVGGVSLGPRGGISWSPVQSGKTAVRGGAGVFFDWFDADAYLQYVQLDGAHQRVETIVAPEYPYLTSEGASAGLGNGRTQLSPLLQQPTVRDMNVAVEQMISSAMRVSVMVMHRRGTQQLRGIDVNAPDASGARPDPSAGPITEVRSIGRSSFTGVSVNVNIMKPERRVFVAANYTLGRAVDEASSPFDLPADSANVAAERGPANDDARHRVTGFANFPLFGGVSAGVSANIRSALPYEITTGLDDNGDTLPRDRPAGGTRNAGRGHASADVSMRLAWRAGFGGSRLSGPSGPQVRILRAGEGNPLAGGLPGDLSQRYGVELYAQVFNALNRLNPVAFSGVMSSPFFGRPVSAAPPRRVEIGGRLTF